jgi:cytochrome c oxidase subunit II
MKWRSISKLIVGAALVVWCAGASLPAPAADAPKRIAVTAKRSVFTPAEITLKKGEPVVLTFESEDVTHGISFKELNLDAEIRKGTATEVPFTPTRTGDFIGHCSRFCGAGHGAMTLTLHVTD